MAKTQKRHLRRRKRIVSSIRWMRKLRIRKWSNRMRRTTMMTKKMPLPVVYVTFYTTTAT